MIDSKKSFFEEFKPTIWFLGKFIGFYFIGSLLYGVYITSYEPEADPVTNVVTRHSSWVLNILGWHSIALNYEGKPTTALEYHGRGIVSVYEGCNGLNVMIVFLSFIVAFGPVNKKAAWFAPVSLAIIYITNLARIVFLFFVVLYFPRYTYYLHKYFFTAFIYLVVLLLWLWWVKKYGKK